MTNIEITKLIAKTTWKPLKFLPKTFAVLNVEKTAKQFSLHILSAIKENLFAIFTHSHSHAFKVISFCLHYAFAVVQALLPSMILEYSAQNPFSTFSPHINFPSASAEKREVKNKNYNLMCLLPFTRLSWMRWFLSTFERTSAWCKIHEKGNFKCKRWYGLNVYYEYWVLWKL